MYRNDLAFAIQVEGKTLRENDGVVHMPYNTQYSIMLRNYRQQRAIATVKIDGKVAISGLIIPANERIVLERFADQAYKFKFIKANAEIRKVIPDSDYDGLVQISYRFEKQNIVIDYPNVWYSSYNTEYFPNNMPSVNCCCSSNNIPEKGITGYGDKSEQGIIRVNDNITLELTEYHLQLMLANSDSRKPELARDRVRCKKCGRNNTPNDTYCGSCGTKLPDKESYPRYFDICYICGEVRANGNKFCPKCGTNLAVRE